MRGEGKIGIGIECSLLFGVCREVVGDQQRAQNTIEGTSSSSELKH